MGFRTTEGACGGFRRRSRSYWYSIGATDVRIGKMLATVVESCMDNYNTKDTRLEQHDHVVDAQLDGLSSDSSHSIKARSSIL